MTRALVLAAALLAACGGGPGTVRLDEAPPGTDYYIDARAAGPAVVGSEIAVAPGSHVFEARSGTTIVAFVVADVVAGETLSLHLVPSAPPPALPPPPIVAPVEPEPPPMPSAARQPSEITPVVSRGRPALQRCYEALLRAEPAAADVRLSVTITIAANGSVSDVDAHRDAGGNHTLSTCIERNVRRWIFPVAGDVTVVEIPVIFDAP